MMCNFMLPSLIIQNIVKNIQVKRVTWDNSKIILKTLKNFLGPDFKKGELLGLIN